MAASEKPAPHPLFKLATELGPLVIFFGANAKFGLFVATAAFMVAIVTAVIVLVFGGLTLFFHDEMFIKLKPTIIYALFAATLGIGLLLGRSFIAIMFDQMFNLTPKGWRLLTIRWMFFFAGMAVLNEIIWRTQSTDFWVSFKAFGVIPITAIFAIAQSSLIKRYSIEPATDEASDIERGDITKS